MVLADKPKQRSLHIAIDQIRWNRQINHPETSTPARTNQCRQIDSKHIPRMAKVRFLWTPFQAPTQKFLLNRPQEISNQKNYV